MTLMRTTQVNPAEEPFAMLAGKKGKQMKERKKKRAGGKGGNRKTRPWLGHITSPIPPAAQPRWRPSLAPPPAAPRSSRSPRLAVPTGNWGWGISKLGAIFKKPMQAASFWFSNKKTYFSGKTSHVAGRHLREGAKGICFLLKEPPAAMLVSGYADMRKNYLRERPKTCEGIVWIGCEGRWQKSWCVCVGMVEMTGMVLVVVWCEYWLTPIHTISLPKASTT